MAFFPKQHKLIRLSAAILLATALSACAPKQETVFIISTNDIHGAIENIPNLATLVARYRAQDTASVFLVDAGDRWTGNPYVDMAVEDGKRVDGKPIIDLMNSLGYDVATFGNHEFDKGIGHLAIRTREAHFPVILANMDNDALPDYPTDPSLTLESMGGTRLTFLGLITNFINGHPDGKDEIFDGINFQSPYETASEYGTLRRGSDVFIALTHIGDDADSLLAVRVPLFDLIIGGHTHRVIDEPLIVNGTRITQTGKSLKYAGITEIRMKGRRIVSIENSLVKLDTVKADDDYREMIKKYYDNPVLAEKIGTLAADMSKTGIINLFTDLGRAELKTDIGLYHLGGIRVSELPAGDVAVKDAFAIEPFSSTFVKTHMTLGQIREMIINKFNDTANPKESHRADIFPSGFSYTIVTDERGEAVDVTFDHKLPYEAGRLYSVAMGDYMYLSYRFDKPVAEEYTGPITDMLIEYFRRNSPVTPDNRDRVFIRQR